MKEEARWIASVKEEIPLHVTRFFPRHRMADQEPTRVETVYRLRMRRRLTCDTCIRETAEFPEK